METLGQFYEILTSTPLRLSHQFRVQVNGPNGKELTVQGKNLAFFAQSTVLPAGTLESSSVSFYGIDFVIPTVRKYSHEWKLTVLCDKDMEVRTTLEGWINEFSNLQKSGGGKKQIPNYNARIDLLDQDLTTVSKTFMLKGVIPAGLGEISLDHKTADIVTFDLNLKYQLVHDEKVDPFGAGSQS